MIKNRLALIILLLIAVISVFSLSSCGDKDDELAGKNIVTFEINGGTLNYGTSSTQTKINFAYEPGTFVLNPVELPNYKIFKNGYTFTGWYTSETCAAGTEWDFENSTIDVKNLTLYAGWKVMIQHTFTLYYNEGDGDVALGTYSVSAGDRFDDWQKFAKTRLLHTAIGYYSDPECTIPWDYSVTHPGGESDLDIPVYVKYIEGEWELVSNYETLCSAIKNGNVYLTCDIDCGGKALPTPTSFAKIFEGNGYTVSNFTVSQGGTVKTPICAIFRTLTASAEIRNVDFTGVVYEFTNIKDGTETVQVLPRFAALTIYMDAGCKVSEVSVSGTLNTNAKEDFATLEAPFWYEETADEAVLAGVTGFEATIEVIKK